MIEYVGGDDGWVRVCDGKWGGGGLGRVGVDICWYYDDCVFGECV